MAMLSMTSLSAPEVNASGGGFSSKPARACQRAERARADDFQSLSFGGAGGRAGALRRFRLARRAEARRMARSALARSTSDGAEISVGEAAAAAGGVSASGGGRVMSGSCRDQEPCPNFLSDRQKSTSLPGRVWLCGRFLSRGRRSSVVERILGKAEVVGSIPPGGTI